jgi:hypothetical protein
METEVQAKEIRSITMHRVMDTDPDLSYLGEYSDSPGEHAIDRRVAEPGDQACCKRCYWSIQYDEPGGWHHIHQNDEPYSETEEAEADHDAEPDSDYSGHGWDSHTYRYFNPVWENYTSCEPQDAAKYERADFERMEAYNRGEWQMVGVVAVAEIVVAGTIQFLRSGGLYGTESDSDPSYFAEIEIEEANQLTTILEELGFERTAIDEACADMTDATD